MMADLKPLIAELESAKAGSRELDDKIAYALFPREEMGNVGEKRTLTFRLGPGHWEDTSRRYTTSIDAALTLVPEGYGVSLTHPKHWDAEFEDKHPYTSVYKVPFNEITDDKFDGTGATLILALDIAALRSIEDCNADD